MPSSYTSLLGLVLPVQGELQGTWGDTVNNELTSLVDSSVAGTTTLSTDADVTLTDTTGAANQARQIILNCTGSRSALRTITAPARSKAYIVINATTGGFGVKIVGTGPTTGVTIASAEKAVVAWNGSDFVKVASSVAGDVNGPASATDNAIARFDGTTGKLIQNSAATVDDTTGDITAGKYNKVTITSPATGSTLTIADGKTLTANNSLTLSGTDSTTMTFPSTSQSIAGLGVAQTFTQAQTFRAASAVRSEAAATQDAVVIAGRAGGTSSYAVTLTPTTLSASQTLTLPDATTTVVGTDVSQTLTNKTLTSPTLTGPTINDGYTEEVYAIPSSTTPALSPTNGSIQTWTLTGNSTPTAGTWAAGQSLTLMVDDGTAYTITWTSVAVTWKTNAGSAPTLNTTGFTVIQLWKVDTTIYGARVGDA